MQLSDSTLQILRNYAGINGNIVVEEGNTLRTISESKTILARVEVEEEFPQTFGIYDLNQFLSTVDLIDEPRLSFDEHSVTIQDGSGVTKTKYFFSDTEILTSPSKDIVMPEGDVSFELDGATLSKLRRAGSTLQLEDLVVHKVDGVITLTLRDTEDSTSNTFSVSVNGESDLDDFEIVLNMRNLKMTDGDYNVVLSSKMISQFVNKTTGVTYWVAIQKNSTF